MQLLGCDLRARPAQEHADPAEPIPIATSQEVPLGYNAYQAFGCIYDRKPTDPVLDHNARCFGEGCIRSNGRGPRSHYVTNFHGGLLDGLTRLHVKFCGDPRAKASMFRS